MFESMGPITQKKFEKEQAEREAVAKEVNAEHAKNSQEAETVNTEFTEVNSDKK
jgi:hypothetical protein